MAHSVINVRNVAVSFVLCVNGSVVWCCRVVRAKSVGHDGGFGTDEFQKLLGGHLPCAKPKTNSLCDTKNKAGKAAYSRQSDDSAGRFLGFCYMVT